MKSATLVMLLFVKTLCEVNAAELNASKPLENPDRVLKGIPENPKNAPYIAYLRIKSYWDAESKKVAKKTKVWCTGFVVSRYWVLTAAHCTQAPYLYNTLNPQHDNRYARVQVRIKVVVGLTDSFALSKRNTNVYYVTGRNVFVHPDAVVYSGRNDERGKKMVDAALLKVAEGFPIGSGVQTIPLMSGQFQTRVCNDECIAIGFGTEGINRAPIQLNYLNVTAGDVSYCRQLLTSNRWRPYHLCIKGMVEGARPCSGDSGSPLVCGHPKRTLAVGVLHGSMQPDYGCGTPMKEVHYISTGHLEQWIRQVTRAQDISFLPYK